MCALRPDFWTAPAHRSLRRVTLVLGIVSSATALVWLALFISSPDSTSASVVVSCAYFAFANLHVTWRGSWWP